MYEIHKRGVSDRSFIDVNLRVGVRRVVEVRGQFPFLRRDNGWDWYWTVVRGNTILLQRVFTECGRAIVLCFW